MKIGIDVSQVIYETGVSVYTRELVSSLVKNYPDNDYVLFGGSLRRSIEIRQFAEDLKAKPIIAPISPTIADILWNRLHVVNIERLVGRVDLFHSSDWAEPPSTCPKVSTIHDLAPLLLPEFTHPKIVEVHKRKFYWVAKEASAVIVPSVASRTDAVKLGISEKIIHVIPEALRRDVKKVSGEEVLKVKKKYRISGSYAISIGNNPRKNTEKIIHAFEKAKVDAKLDKLVIVGRGKAFSSNIGVIYAGHVPNTDLPALYSGADVLVYPSLYEGFGLPILEGFACELPVVTSNISCMPEIAGKAGVLVDPYSVDSISEGILEAVNKKKDLVKLGKERIKDFSWEKTAKLTMDVYKGLV